MLEVLQQFGWNMSNCIPADANNISDFAFRMVTVFEPSTSEYLPINTSYSATGMLSIDDVVFTSRVSASVNENVLSNFTIFQTQLLMVWLLFKHNHLKC